MYSKTVCGQLNLAHVAIKKTYKNETKTVPSASAHLHCSISTGSRSVKAVRKETEWGW